MTTINKINPHLMAYIYSLFGIFLMLIPLMYILDVIKATQEGYWLLFISGWIVVLTSLWNNVSDVVDDILRRKNYE